MFKVDLENLREVPTEKAEQLAKELNLIYLETSAKCGYNIRQLFRRIGDALPDLDPSLKIPNDLHEVYLESVGQKAKNNEQSYCLC